MVHTIDLHFQGIERAIAAYLIELPAGPVLIETGPYSCFDTLQRSLRQKDIAIEDLRAVFLTHIHLDHAGAAWAFAQKGVPIYCHPLGERHLKGPERLVQSAARIYGDQMDSLWGAMEPIAEEHLQIVEHEEIVHIGEDNLCALHTPGHAKHHVAWQWKDFIFTGDVGGVRIGSGPVVPPCPPPDINVKDWQSSLRILREKQPSALFLTHFGRVDQVHENLEQLENHLLDWAAWMKPHFEAEHPMEIVTPQFQDFVQEQLRRAGVDDTTLQQYELANPSWMSVAGLYRYWKKRTSEN